MTDCGNVEVREALPELLHGRLTPEARRAVEAHLAECPACAAERALLEHAREVLSHAPAVDVAAVVRALPRPPAAVRPAASAPARRRSRTMGAWAPAALAAGLALAAALWRGPVGGPADAPTMVVADTPAAVRGGEGVAGSAAAMPVPLDGRLSADDLVALLEELETLEALPAEEPQPVVSAFDLEETL